MKCDQPKERWLSKTGSRLVWRSIFRKRPYLYLLRSKSVITGPLVPEGKRPSAGMEPNTIIQFLIFLFYSFFSIRLQSLHLTPPSHSHPHPTSSFSKSMTYQSYNCPSLSHSQSQSLLGYISLPLKNSHESPPPLSFLFFKTATKPTLPYFKPNLEI